MPKLKYLYIDSSGQNDRVSVPDPSDYILKALLYFDTATMEQFYGFNRNAEYDSPNLKKGSIQFRWASN
jgi:hypothetical protein